MPESPKEQYTTSVGISISYMKKSQGSWPISLEKYAALIALKIFCQGRFQYRENSGNITFPTNVNIHQVKVIMSSLFPFSIFILARQEGAGPAAASCFQQMEKNTNAEDEWRRFYKNYSIIIWVFRSFSIIADGLSLAY